MVDLKPLAAISNAAPVAGAISDDVGRDGDDVQPGLPCSEGNENTCVWPVANYRVWDLWKKTLNHQHYPKGTYIAVYESVTIVAGKLMTISHELGQRGLYNSVMSSKSE